MKRFPEIEIPKECDTVDKQTDYLSRLIDSEFQKSNKAAATATHHSVKMGEYFYCLKKIVKSAKKSWGYYISRQFPYLSERTIQRYMALGKFVDLETHPALAFVCQKDLLDLTMTCRERKQSVGELAERHKIEVSNLPERKEEIESIQNKMNVLAEELYTTWVNGEPENDAEVREKKRSNRAIRRRLKKIRKEKYESLEPDELGKRIKRSSKSLIRHLRQTSKMYVTLANARGLKDVLYELGRRIKFFLGDYDPITSIQDSFDDDDFRIGGRF